MVGRSSVASGELVTPMAELVGKLKRTSERFPTDLECAARVLFENYLQFTASVLAAAYLKLGLSDSRADGAIRQLRYSATDGTWYGCIDALAKALPPGGSADVPQSIRDIRDAHNSADLPEETKAFGEVVQRLQGREEGVTTSAAQYSTVAEFLRFTIDYRNLTTHSGRNWLALHLEELAAPFAKAMRALVAGTSWLGDYPLFCAREVEVSGGSFTHVGDLYSGETPSEARIELTSRLPENVLVFDPEDAAVPLEPFYHVDVCATPHICRGERIFAVSSGMNGDEQSYSHPLCGNVVAGVTKFGPAWKRLFAPASKEGKRSGVECTQSVAPCDRPVYCGEKFHLRFHVRNMTDDPITDVSLDAELPEDVVSLREKIATVGTLAPGKRADFEYVLSTYADRKVTVPPARIRYTLAGGRVVERPMPEIVVPVSFNYFPRLVGREEETSRLKEGLAHAMRGRLELVAVAGEPGVGKSSLISDFFEVVRRRKDCSVLTTRCFESDLDPFAAITDLVKRFLHYYSGKSGEDLMEAVREVKGRSLPDFFTQDLLPADLLAIFAKVMDLPPLLPGAASGRPAGAPGEATAGRPDIAAGLGGVDGSGVQRKLLFLAVHEAFLHICERGPLVLIVEDVHLMRDDCWDLFKYLLPRLANKAVLVLVSLGPETCAEGPLEGGRPYGEARSDLLRCGAEIMDLEPLPYDGVIELLDALLPGAPALIPESQKKEIVDFCQGYPKWLVETVRVLRSQGKIVYRQGGWRIASDAGALDLSTAFSDIVRQRYETLEPELRSVVDRAAILGVKFSRTLLDELTSRGRRRPLSIELNSLLRQLEEIHHLIRESDLDLEFVNAQIHRIIYGQIQPSVRREMHRVVAGLLEEKDDRESYSSQLAFHWSSAGEPAKAIGYLESGAERLERNMAYSEAIAGLQRALNLRAENPALRDEEWVFRATRRLSRLHWLSGDMSASLELDAENVERGLHRKLFRDVCELYRIMSISHSCRGESERALEMARRGMDLADRQKMEDEGYKLRMQLGLLERDGRHFESGERLLDECREYARAQTDAWMEAESLRNLGILHRMKGEYETSRRCFEQALERFEALDGSSRLFGLGMTHDNAAALALQTGDLDGAERHLERSLQCRRRSNDLIGMSRGLHSQAKLLFLGGNVDEARPRIRESIDIKMKIDDQEGIAKSRLLEGHILAEMDDWGEAMESCREALDCYEKLGLAWGAARTRVAMARVLIAQGRTDESDALMAEVREQDMSGWGADARADAQLVEADLARLAGRTGEARERLASARSQYREEPGTAQRSGLDFCDAMLCIDEGRPADAAELLERGLERLCREGSPYMRARYHNLLGRALRGVGEFDRAVDVLEQGIVVMEEIGDRLGVALALDGMGKIELERGRKEDARLHFEKALSVKRRLGDERGVAISRELLGRCRE